MEAQRNFTQFKLKLNKLNSIADIGQRFARKLRQTVVAVRLRSPTTRGVVLPCSAKKKKPNFLPPTFIDCERKTEPELSNASEEGLIYVFIKLCYSQGTLPKLCRWKDCLSGKPWRAKDCSNYCLIRTQPTNQPTESQGLGIEFREDLSFAFPIRLGWRWWEHVLGRPRVVANLLIHRV